MNVKIKSPVFVTLGVLAALVLSACVTRVNSELSQQCTDGLKVAEEELDFAKAKGFSGSLSWSKAATLITAANIQKQFEKYPNCVEKVKAARELIKDSQR
jgi:hypothetical protein